MIEPTFEPAFNAFISHVESFRVLLTGAPVVLPCRSLSFWSNVSSRL